MAVKVFLFGKLKQITGSSELEVDALDTDEMINEIIHRFPLLKDQPFLIAVDKTVVHANTVVQDGQDIALLPPYSGG